MFPLLLACTQDPGAKDTTPDPSDSAPPCGDERTWYADDDGDTFGDAGESFFGCEPSDAFVLDASDCDDTDAAVNPGVAEDACEDGVDANCDGADPACGFEPVEDLAEALPTVSSTSPRPLTAATSAPIRARRRERASARATSMTTGWTMCSWAPTAATLRVRAMCTSARQRGSGTRSMPTSC